MSKKLPTSTSLQEISAEYRETYAREVLAYDAVKLLMAEGASLGYDGVRIAQEKPLSLDKTKAGMAVVALLKKVGHKPTWIDSATGMEGFASDYKKATKYNELLIMWGSPEGSILHKVELPEEAENREKHK